MRSTGGAARRAAAVAAGYALFGILWILFSDRVVHLTFSDPGTLHAVQSVKGVAFIGVTAVLLFVVVWRTSAGWTGDLFAQAKRVARLGGEIQRMAEPSARRFASEAVRALRDSTGAAKTAYFAADESGETLALDAASGFDPGVVERARPFLRFRAGEEKGVVGLVAATRRALYLADAPVDPRWVPADPSLLSAYWAPVIHGERLYGVLAMFAVERDAFTPAQQALADLVAGLAGSSMEQVRLAAAQGRASRTARELVETSPMGIFRLSLDGRLLAVNPAIAEATGYAGPDELLAAVADRPGALFVEPAEFDRFFAAVKEQGSVSLFDAVIRGRGGRPRCMMLTVRTVRDTDATAMHYEGTVVDITPRKRAERDLAEAQDRLARAQRFSAVGEVASTAAHDFNNALTPVLGYAEMIMDERTANRPEMVAKYANLIRRGAQDAAGIVSRLRELYKPGAAGGPKPVRLAAVARDIADLTRPRWHRVAENGRSVELRVEVEGDPVVRGDDAALREAGMNLVFNAVDASPRGGTIALRARERGDAAVLEVADQGEGMSEEARRRCLEPFFTTKGERGTGLGLASVKRIVEQHGGSLDIASSPGAGTTFSMAFPRAPAA